MHSNFFFYHLILKIKTIVRLSIVVNIYINEFCFSSWYVSMTYVYINLYFPFWRFFYLFFVTTWKISIYCLQRMHCTIYYIKVMTFSSFQSVKIRAVSWEKEMGIYCLSTGCVCFIKEYM